MTTTRQLYSLQELDLALEHIEMQKAEAERELGARMSLSDVEAALQRERERSQHLQTSYRLDQLEVESLRQRSAELEAKLYSGTLTSPREMESLQQEVSHVQGQLQQRDSALLEMAIKAEESLSECTFLEKQLSDDRATWEKRQIELKEEMKRLDAERASMLAQRAQLAASVKPAELKQYDILRRAKGGRAVAKVERGLCQVCRMSLPTQQLQKVRSGRQTVLCSSCGRMLFIG